MFKQYGIEVAIKKLRPGASFSLYNSEITSWEDSLNREPPTREEIDAQVQRDKKEYDYHKYQIYRFESYPEGFVQLDMLWHDMDNGTIPGKEGIWYNAIKEIKDKFPKPTEPLELD